MSKAELFEILSCEDVLRILSADTHDMKVGLEE
jgi:hypothetical protein